MAKIRPMIRFRYYTQDTMGVYNPYRSKWRKKKKLKRSRR